MSSTKPANSYHNTSDQSKQATTTTVTTSSSNSIHDRALSPAGSDGAASPAMLQPVEPILDREEVSASPLPTAGYSSAADIAAAAAVVAAVQRQSDMAEEIDVDEPQDEAPSAASSAASNLSLPRKSSTTGKLTGPPLHYLSHLSERVPGVLALYRRSLAHSAETAHFFSQKAALDARYARDLRQLTQSWSDSLNLPSSRPTSQPADGLQAAQCTLRNLVFAYSAHMEEGVQNVKEDVAQAWKEQINEANEESLPIVDETAALLEQYEKLCEKTAKERGKLAKLCADLHEVQHGEPLSPDQDEDEDESASNDGGGSDPDSVPAAGGADEYVDDVDSPSASKSKSNNSKKNRSSTDPLDFFTGLVTGALPPPDEHTLLKRIAKQDTKYRSCLEQVSEIHAELTEAIEQSLPNLEREQFIGLQQNITHLNKFASIHAAMYQACVRNTTAVLQTILASSTGGKSGVKNETSAVTASKEIQHCMRALKSSKHGHVVGPTPLPQYRPVKGQPDSNGNTVSNPQGRKVGKLHVRDPKQVARELEEEEEITLSPRLDGDVPESKEEQEADEDDESEQHDTAASAAAAAGGGSNQRLPTNQPLPLFSSSPPSLSLSGNRDPSQTPSIPSSTSSEPALL